MTYPDMDIFDDIDNENSFMSTPFYKYQHSTSSVDITVDIDISSVDIDQLMFNDQ